ncbi:polyprenyl synthetase family protein [Streptomyces sp. NPDC008121]|uniref:polyprenyl synthetase family protein n=1 Tax=Streptomyces sp. NPDC008121 TaxID=3364809 RepID=UPI0036E7ECD8
MLRTSATAAGRTAAAAPANGAALAGATAGGTRTCGPRTAGEAIAAVEVALADHLDHRVREARAIDDVFAGEVAQRVAGFVRGGGRRLRTAFVWCGWQAAGGGGDPDGPVRIGAAIELLQACALIHDDLMDGSPVRRGAPAVHRQFAELHRTGRMNGSADAYAATAAVLAGDLALAWADDLLTETALALPPHAGRQVHGEWRAMRGEMVAGQYRDVRAQATGSSAVDEALGIATLKSALYTVVRPLALGARMACAETDDRALDALRAAGRCAGLAFQVRDDLLGVYGDPAETGKPADDDLRARKLTYLLAVALKRATEARDADAVDALGPGRAPRSEPDIARMRAALERTGARAVVEDEIVDLCARSVRHFASTGAGPRVQAEFAALVATAAGLRPAPEREGSAAGLRQAPERETVAELLRPAADTESTAAGLRPPAERETP